MDRPTCVRFRAGAIELASVRTNGRGGALSANGENVVVTDVSTMPPRMHLPPSYLRGELPAALLEKFR